MAFGGHQIIRYTLGGKGERQYVLKTFIAFETKQFFITAGLGFIRSVFNDSLNNSKQISLKNNNLREFTLDLSLWCPKPFF